MTDTAWLEIFKQLGFTYRVRDAWVLVLDEEGYGIAGAELADPNCQSKIWHQVLQHLNSRKPI